MPIVDFFYDVGSPYSYLASTQVESIVSDCGATLRWRPFLVGAVFKATQNAAPAFNIAKARYMAEDLQRWAKYYGVPLRMAMPPLNTILPMRVLAGLSEAEVPKATHRLFHAWWVDGVDFSEPTLLSEWFGADAVERAQLPEVKERLRANTDEAVTRGAFGAPTFFIDDQMYFGNDRLPFLEQRLRALSRP